MTKRLHRSGLLVVTRCDSLRAADRRALLNRLRHETEGLFAGIVMLSIPDARDAQDPVSGALDGERWQQSGGETLAAELQNAVEVVAAEDDLPDTPEPAPPRTKIKTPTASVSGAADALEVPLSVDPEPARLSDQSMEPATMGSLSPIDVAGLLDNMLDAMPACRFMAYVDLDSARPLAVSVRGQMGTPPRMDDSLAVLAVDLFIGPASTSMRRLALKGATVERDSADMIREVTIEGGRVHYVLLRRQDQPNHALIAIIDKDQPISLALAASRMTLTKFVEQQQRERSDETAASAEEAS
jgi:hypothetical protein